jgi:hypothetical protein
MGDTCTRRSGFVTWDEGYGCLYKTNITAAGMPRPWNILGGLASLITYNGWYRGFVSEENRIRTGFGNTNKVVHLGMKIICKFVLNLIFPARCAYRVLLLLYSLYEFVLFSIFSNLLKLKHIVFSSSLRHSGGLNGYAGVEMVHSVSKLCLRSC